MASVRAAVGRAPVIEVDIRDDLLNALKAIQAPGSFASFSSLANQPPANLLVHDVGNIAMPLSESQALQLIAKARQAPYGKGNETLVDTAVRNTWELDPDQFTFQNPRWPVHLNEILRQVAKNLGINGAIRAEIYKMLIYEKGAMFKPHTDTEKIPGMFGTMVICLPSPHEGGEVVVKHCGQRKVFSTSKQTQSVATWYSDVSHEVLPVTSGYRWVLTYNLCHDLSQPRPTAGLPESDVQQLHQVLSRWLSASPDSRTNNYLYHVLDHDYTQANISLQALKTQDLARVGALGEIRRQLPIKIFLALLEKSEMGSCEVDYTDIRGGRPWDDYDDYEVDDSGFHALQDVLETEYKINTLVDLDGHVVSEGLYLDEEDILEEGCFEDIEAEEEYEGYMGNSGPTATHWYRVAAVVIVPQASLFGFFDNGGRMNYSVDNLPSQLTYLARECLLPQAPQSSIDGLVEFCQRKPTLSISEDALEHVFKAALHHERYELFEQMARHHPGHLAADFLRWLGEWLGTEHYETRFSSIKTGISSIISLDPFLAHQVDMIRAIASFSRTNPPGVSQNPDFMRDWACEMLRSCFDSSKLEKLGTKDGAAVVKLVGFFDEPAAFIKKTVMQKLGQNTNAAPFTIGLLSRLDQDTKPKMTTEDCTRLSQSLAASFVTATDFTKVCSKEAAEIRAKGRHYTVAPAKPESRGAIAVQQLVEVFSIVMKLSTEATDLTRQLISKMVNDAPQMSSLELHATWLPFLSSLLPLLISKHVPLGTECYQQLYSAILKAYLDKFVMREPVVNTSLVRPRVNCSCDDCDSLNRFLISDQKVGHFAVNKKRRMHLHQRLDGAHIDCTHETWRSGSPQTLVVTKTFRQHAENHKSWKSRRNLAAEQIEKFDRGQLQDLLGSDYVSIATLSRVSARKPPRARAAGSSASARPRTPVAGSNASAGPRTPVAGEKRKLPFEDVQVIDLTED